MDIATIHVTRCDRSQWEDALSVLYGHMPPDERDNLMGHVLRGAVAGAFELDGLMVARYQEVVLGAMLCMGPEGRSLFVWPPRTRLNLPHRAARSVEQLLFEAMRRLARNRQARIVQAMLTAEDRDQDGLLLSAGFQRLARILFLRRSVPDHPDWRPQLELRYHTYTPEMHPQFGRVVEQTYNGSLDTPELTGVRTMDDVLDSHRAQGTEFDPRHWLLADRDGQTVGVLLLADLPRNSALEIAYLGVIPEARGQGIGRELTRRALREAADAHAESITLTMDARNVPALRMYQSEGFEVWDERDAYFLMLGDME